MLEVLDAVKHRRPSALLSGRAGSHYFHDGCSSATHEHPAIRRGAGTERSLAQSVIGSCPLLEGINSTTRRETLRKLDIAAVSLVIIGGINWAGAGSG
jgi:hypothetical protein